MSNKQLAVRANTDKMDRLDEIAKAHGVTTSDIVRMLIDRFLAGEITLEIKS